MKEYLIDTHILIWAILEDPRLSRKVEAILKNPENTIYVPQVALYEIAIKQKLKKLPDFDISINELVEKIGLIDFQIMSVKNEHIDAYNSIDLVEDHRDPFDRLIIATAFHENMPVISVDEKFKSYQSQIQLIDNQ
jgi:PIN domain nuclease of toxin-antitoxin system